MQSGLFWPGMTVIFSFSCGWVGLQSVLMNGWAALPWQPSSAVRGGEQEMSMCQWSGAILPLGSSVFSSSKALLVNTHWLCFGECRVLSECTSDLKGRPLEQISFNLFGLDFWKWSEPAWDKAHNLLYVRRWWVNSWFCPVVIVFFVRLGIFYKMDNVVLHDCVFPEQNPMLWTRRGSSKGGGEMTGGCIRGAFPGRSIQIPSWVSTLQPFLTFVWAFPCWLSPLLPVLSLFW